MLTVMKRNGEKEAFSEEKLCNAVANASDEIQQPLTKGDIDSVLEDMLRILDCRTVVTSREIFIVVCGILYARGFEDIAKAYKGHSSNAWR